MPTAFFNISHSICPSFNSFCSFWFSKNWRDLFEFCFTLLPFIQKVPAETTKLAIVTRLNRNGKILPSSLYCAFHKSIIGWQVAFNAHITEYRKSTITTQIRSNGKWKDLTQKWNSMSAACTQIEEYIYDCVEGDSPP